jgi:ABC-type transport system involved in multi-copper enzyme maturation permease subunit
MIWATLRMYRSIIAASLVVAALFATWLLITGLMESHAWANFVSHHCLLNDPGSSSLCITSLSNVGNFSSVNATLCGVLPPLLGLVLGVPLVAGEIQQRTNRLAWSQSISRTRWLVDKVVVVAVVTAVIVGALLPLVWWWTEAAHRSHLQPSNFDISGFVEVSYSLFALMLGVTIGAIVRRTGWAFAASVPVFFAIRALIREYIRSSLVSPVSSVVSTQAPLNSNSWYLNEGFVPVGRLSPSSGQSWSSQETVLEKCQRSVDSFVSLSRCESIHHLHYVVQYQPASHYWALQSAESAIFIAISVILLGVVVSVIRNWRT